MKKYRFDLLTCSIAGFKEKDHIIQAWSLQDAVTKFTRKHELEAPAYWDEPAFEKTIDLIFRNDRGTVEYRIAW